MAKTWVTAPVTSSGKAASLNRGKGMMPTSNAGGVSSHPEANQLPVWKKAACPERKRACAAP
jgi:hypothetical protein